LEKSSLKEKKTKELINYLLCSLGRVLLPIGTHGLSFGDCSGKFIQSQVILCFISSDTAVSFKTYEPLDSQHDNLPKGISTIKMCV